MKTFIILLIPLLFGCTKQQPKLARFQSVIDTTFQGYPNAVGIMVHVRPLLNTLKALIINRLFKAFL
jgi:hypothetical protein